MTSYAIIHRTVDGELFYHHSNDVVFLFVDETVPGDRVYCLDQPIDDASVRALVAGSKIGHMHDNSEAAKRLERAVNGPLS